MIEWVKKLSKRSKTLVIAQNLINNWRVSRRVSSGNIETSYGSSHSHISDLSDSVAYINSTYEDYLRYAELSPGAIRGKRVLEIGHGDNLGVALRFLAAGAAEVVCLDKFYSKRDPERQREIYLALRAELDGEARRRFDEVIDLTSSTEIISDRLKSVYGTGIEDAVYLFGADSFDLIISRAVLQSIQEIDAALASMERLLAGGGAMAHKIDLRDLGMFTCGGMHPLTFLTIQDSLYRRMTSATDKSNRRLAGYYSKKIAEVGLESKIFITEIVGQSEEIIPHKEKIVPGVDYSDASLALINEIRPRLNAKFKHLPDEELLVSSIFLVAGKPAQQGYAADLSLRVACAKEQAV
ncbi:MAG TPA: methyltransferase domain-containing protein [Blastocatellia bacterium]|nr:methyltransferase domain-containing protein [Blastocatellia bacterium]